MATRVHAHVPPSGMDTTSSSRLRQSLSTQRDVILSPDPSLQFARENIGCCQCHTTVVLFKDDGLGHSHRMTRQPVVSTANIAQLTVDLLIASLSLRLVGVFDSRDLVPVVGGREDGEEGVSTPLERELFGRPSSSKVPA